MAKKKTKRRKAGKKTNRPLPGWIYMLFGLGTGLAIAYAYFTQQEFPRRPAQPTPVMEAPEPAPAPAQVAAPAEEEPEDTGITFDFYDMLPELDVEVFNDEPSRRPASAPAQQPAAPVRVKTPGIYILQAGSFTTLPDAKRREGEIALLGVQADIKKGDANGRTVYRVYTRPLESTDEVNRLSSLLNDNNIETLPKRVK